MSRIILFNLMTLDGFFEGPDRDISWHNVDAAFNDFAIEQLDSAGGLIFGRVTYELMASYWPTQPAIESDPQVANRMNRIPKMVFSRTLEEAGWENTRLIKGDAVEAIQQIKRQPGGDLFIFGSADLAGSLIRNGLIDEYRILLNPLILGGGTPHFKELPEPVKLKLLSARPFENGNVLLIYAPE